MGLLSKIFKKSSEPKEATLPKGFVQAKVKQARKITENSVEIQFDANSLPNDFQHFVPGQYITLSINFEGKEYRRSYSLCSAPSEGLAIGVKKLQGGKVSSFLVDYAESGMTINISKPEGNFKLLGAVENPVFIAAGSGITPILSMMKTMEQQGKKSTLLFGNRNINQVMFLNEIQALQHVEKHYFLSKEKQDGYAHKRLDFENLKTIFKEQLPLLRAGGFYICGPEEMIKGAIEALNFFGVAEDKIHFELFTEAKLLKKESPQTAESFSGDADVTITLDGMEENFTLNTKGHTLLDAVLEIGLDAPYSCKGGVCSTCRAKVTAGSVKMNNNLTLTNGEVAEGYILTCQAHPTSKVLKVTYDA
jgi:ring-1,2-phenylacetyl-CoA epoxidase subunit PaaE